MSPTLSTAEAAEMFGCSTDTLYALVRQGAAPVRPLRLGSKLRWPTALVLDVLGIGPPDERRSPAAPGPSSSDSTSNVATIARAGDR